MEKAPPSRREARKEERREAILHVAKRSFLENGYSATSMSAIAAELGGSKGTLWSYFPSKQDLFTAVLDQATSQYREDLSAVLQPSGEIERTILGFCESFMRKITSAEALALHRLIAAESSRFPEIGQIFYERAPLATQVLLAQFLDSQMARDILKRGDALQAARVLMSLCMGDVHQRMLWGQPAASESELTGQAELATAIFLQSYRA